MKRNRIPGVHKKAYLIIMTEPLSMKGADEREREKGGNREGREGERRGGQRGGGQRAGGEEGGEDGEEDGGEDGE